MDPNPNSFRSGHGPKPPTTLGSGSIHRPSPQPSWVRSQIQTSTLLVSTKDLTLLGPDTDPHPQTPWVRGLDTDLTPKPPKFEHGPSPNSLGSGHDPLPNSFGSEHDPNPNPLGSGYRSKPQPPWVRTRTHPPTLLGPDTDPSHLGPIMDPTPTPFGPHPTQLLTPLGPAQDPMVMRLVSGPKSLGSCA
uniref:Uncharacterized protein n=1 Tax=Populus trichocarpa TaxID=3694 RepID=B9GSG9_POPTR